jgi:hypothetical protein
MEPNPITVTTGVTLTTTMTSDGQNVAQAQTMNSAEESAFRSNTAAGNMCAATT